MFDFEKAREMMNVEQFAETVNTVVDTTVDKMEASANTFTGFIPNEKAKEMFKVMTEAQYSTVRSAISNYRSAVKSISI